MKTGCWHALKMGFLVAVCLGLALFAAASDTPDPSPGDSSRVGLGQSVTQLADGSWLLLGGREESTGAVTGHAALLDSAEQHPEDLAERLTVPRAGQSATVLPDGSVLVIGGVNADGQPVADVERFHPAERHFEDLGDVGLQARDGQTATLLSNGQLLLVGGTDVSSLVHQDAQLLDTATLRPVPTFITLSEARSGQEARLLASGDVLVWGGRDQNGEPVKSAEVYDATEGRFFPVDSATAATLIADGLSDPSAPSIAATSPAPQDAAVPLDKRISLRFSKPLDPRTLTDQNVTLVGPTGAVPSAVVAAERGMLAFVNPKEPLRPGVHYTLLVAGATDRSGQPLPFAWLAFRTLPFGQAMPQASSSPTTEPKVLPRASPAADSQRRSQSPAKSAPKASAKLAAVPHLGSPPAPNPSSLRSRVATASAMGSTQEARTYFVTDATGSPVVATDANGNTVWTEDYLPYGERRINSSGSSGNQRWFTGAVQNPDTTLLYFGHRFMDPVQGRFVSIDPQDPSLEDGDNFNRYSYASDNPYAHVDPNGGSIWSIAAWYSFGKDNGKLLINEGIYVCARIAGNEGVAEIAVEEIHASVENAALSTIGVISPFPGTGKLMGRAVKAFEQGEETASSATRLVEVGRAGRQARLRELAADDKLGSADRGWLKQEINSIERGQRKTIRNPPGKDLAHQRGREAAKGYDYSHSNLQDRDLHQLQHKYDDFGRANAERPPPQ